MIYDGWQLEAQAFAKACSRLDEDIISRQSRNDHISLKRSVEIVSLFVSNLELEVSVPESSSLELATECEVNVNTRIRPLKSKRHGDT